MEHWFVLFRIGCPVLRAAGTTDTSPESVRIVSPTVVHAEKATRSLHRKPR